MICGYSSALTGEYNVTQAENGSIVLEWNMNGTVKEYTIMLTNQNETLRIKKHLSPCEIPSNLLKPCTNYTVEVEGCRPSAGNSIHFTGK